MPNYDETLVLIDELANLPVGWRYGEGVAIKPVFVDRIKKLVKMFELDGLERFNVFAEVDGGFILRTYFQDYFFEITYSAEDGIHVSIEDKTDVIVFEEDASPDTVSNVYQRFLVEICHLYEPSTKETMTEKSDSLSEPSSNEATMEVFQPLTSNVLHWTPYQYAPTLPSSIRSVVSDPPIYFTIPQHITDGFQLGDEPSESGDKCHRDIFGWNRGEKKKFVKTIKMSDLRTCDNGTDRESVLSDFA